MHDAIGVRDVERVGDLGGEIEHLAQIERPARNRLLQGAAVEPLHHDELLALVLGDLVNRADVGVIEARCGPRLVQESPAGGFVGRSPGRQELQHDRATEDEVLGEIHDGRRALAELLDHLVVRERASRDVGYSHVGNRPPPRAGVCMQMHHPLLRESTRD